MKKYRITPPARRDVYGILAYLADEANVEVAIRYRTLLTEAFCQLGEYPHSGHVREDITSRPLRFYQVRPYMIVYAIHDGFVMIHGVFHGSRDGKSLMSNRAL